MLGIFIAALSNPVIVPFAISVAMVNPIVHGADSLDSYNQGFVAQFENPVKEVTYKVND